MKDHPDKPQRRSYKTAATRLTISLPQGLLELVDQAAKADFTTRSDIIRIALLWYLRPQGRDLAETDPEAIFKTLKHRRSMATLRAMLKDQELDTQE